MNLDTSTSPADSGKTKKSSRRKIKSARSIIPLLIVALFFGYRQVSRELEKKAQQREEYAIEASVREITKQAEKKRMLKDFYSDLPKDIIAAFAEQRDNPAINRIVGAAFEDSTIYINAVHQVLQDGEHKVALQAALLYCSEIDDSKERNKKEHSSMGACLEKFGFKTAVAGDQLTITAGGEQSEKASARQAQGD
ncbi:MAG: hypothetical protein LBC55_09475 [Desulfovibrio sp.]|jgi:hypothetical protein|nr:hypothetical protein [Desulfovibrio sp.]